MVTEHQEKSIKHIDYCYSFYFSNIFRPFLLAYTSALGALDYQDISWKPILLPMLVLSIYTRNSPYPSTLKKT